MLDEVIVLQKFLSSLLLSEALSLRPPLAGSVSDHAHTSPLLPIPKLRYQSQSYRAWQILHGYRPGGRH